MGVTSDAVTLDRVSRIIGYKLTTGNFATTTPNLPQRIAILAEANEANQTDLVTDPYQIISATDAGKKYGYGSPIHMIARILLPKFGGGVAGIRRQKQSEPQQNKLKLPLLVLLLETVHIML